MRYAVLPAIALLLAPASAAVFAAPARAGDLSAQTARDVTAAEHAFAAECDHRGMAQAFRDWLDPKEGLEFGGPKPLHGAEAVFQAFGAGKPEPLKLHWVPISAWGSKGGDMGVTTGDWVQTDAKSAKRTATGRYVTVWRKNPAGQWKALIDIGETDAAPEPNAATGPDK